MLRDFLKHKVDTENNNCYGLRWCLFSNLQLRLGFSDYFLGLSQDEEGDGSEHQGRYFSQIFGKKCGSWAMVFGNANPQSELYLSLEQKLPMKYYFTKNVFLLFSHDHFSELMSPIKKTFNPGLNRYLNCVLYILT